MSYKFLWFSGVRLYLINGPVTKSWLAVSGKPTGDSSTIKFDYSKTAQGVKDLGHCQQPSMQYELETSELISTLAQHMPKPPPTYSLSKRPTIFHGRTMRGARQMAMQEEFPILSKSGGSDYGDGRNNCWIHGSDFPGSIGCIDLCENMDQLVNSLLDLKLDPKRMLPLFVKYGVTPDGARESRDVDPVGRDISKIA